MKKTILVTGASGVLGRAAVAELSAQGFRVRGAARRPQDAAAAAGGETVAFDYCDPATHRAALEGVDGVLLIAPPLDVEAHLKLNPFIDLVRKLGVAEVVLNSALGADASDQAPLRQVELHLAASGLPHTVLRPNFFMENFSAGFLAPMVATGGIHLAAADGRTSFVSVTDLAAAVAASFSRPHQGRAWNLTGPEALDHAEVAGILSRAWGREIAYHPISEQQMVQGALAAGLPESAAGFMALLYDAVRNGWAAGVSPDLRELSGKKPTSFAEFAERSRTARG